MSDRAPQTGDYVLCWAQVVDDNPHPDNMLVRFASHNEHYTGYVRRVDIVFTGELPPNVEKCEALFTEPGNSTYYVKCTLHHEHGGDHKDLEGRFYEDREVVGYFERK